MAPSIARQVWWVNQGLTYHQEQAGGFLWAPRRSQGGRAFRHWDTLAEVKAGDVIVHYCRGAVVALSRALADGQPSARPEGFTDAGSEREGRLVRTEYFVLRHPIPRDRVAAKIHALSIPDGRSPRHTQSNKGISGASARPACGSCGQRRPTSGPSGPKIGRSGAIRPDSELRRRPFR